MKRISDAELQDAFKELARQLGHIPTVEEIDNAPETASYQTYAQRFGGIDALVDGLEIDLPRAKDSQWYSKQECEDALTAVACRTEQTLTMERYDSLRDDEMPASKTVLKRLGGGSFNDAKEQAGVEVTTGYGCRREFSEPEYVDLLERALEVTQPAGVIFAYLAHFPWSTVDEIVDATGYSKNTVRTNISEIDRNVVRLARRQQWRWKEYALPEEVAIQSDSE